MESAVAAWILDPETGFSAFLAMVIAASRPLGFVMICPVFLRFGIQRGLVRGGIIVALMAPVLPVVIAQFAESAAPPPAGAGLVLVLFKELLVGMVAGMIVGLPFWAISAAGDFIDFQRGASMSMVVDPGSGGETSVTGTLLMLVSIATLIGSGLFIPAVIGPIYDSYRVVPVMSVPDLDPARAALMARWLGQLFRAGVVLALPVLLPLLLVEFFLALSLKYIQQLNAMVLAMAVKQAVYVLILMVYAGLAARYAMGGLGDPDGAMLGAIFGVGK